MLPHYLTYHIFDHTDPEMLVPHSMQTDLACSELRDKCIKGSIHFKADIVLATYAW